MILDTPSLTRRGCIDCDRTMTPEFKQEPPYQLEGWRCQCGWWDKAILRERRFTKADAEAEDRR